MWIHEYENWTNFTWDSKTIDTKLEYVSRQQRQLFGDLAELGFRQINNAQLSTLTNDIVKSWAIEGEKLNPEEVRSYIARKLGIDIAGLIPASRDVDGIVEMILNATQYFSTSLTKDRLFGWHAALFPTGFSNLRKIIVGNWRTKESGTMQVVSGPFGKEKVHFEAPNAERLEKEMRGFLEWFNNGIDVNPFIKAGIAHFWFVTIHPFEDGNGRIARVIGDMALARAGGSSKRFYSMSSQIEAEQKDYYNQLEKQQRSSPEITDWLVWFLDNLDRSITSAEVALGNTLFKAKLWATINENPVNDRQRLIINRMLEDDFIGYMNTSKYAKMTKCNDDTALWDVQELKDRGIFIQIRDDGRNTSYRLPNKND